MIDSDGLWVSDTRGPVHAGTGDQYNWIAEQASAGVKSSRKQAADDLRWLAQRFVHPRGFGVARDILLARRTVFLDALPGSGRIAAAKMLLWELRPEADKFHELLIQEKDRGTRIDPSHIVEADRTWLDLSEVREPDWGDIHAELLSLRWEVQERDAYLVVVMPHDVSDAEPEFDQYRAQIERPRAHEVFRRHLVMEGIPEPDVLSSIEFLNEHRPIRDFPRFVRLIAEAKAMERGAGEFPAWCKTAPCCCGKLGSRQMTNLRDHIRQWIEKAVASIGLTDGEYEKLARRFAEQCMAERYKSIWTSLVEVWSGQHNRNGMKAAVAVLKCGLEDEECGRICRRQIYDWSRTDGMSIGRAEVIILACRDYMAISHPDEALVRLHHVARREPGMRAREALLDLAGQDRRFFRQLMSRVTDTNPERRRWRADTSLFLDLADAGVLTDPGKEGRAFIVDNDMRRQLTDGWRLAFAHPYGEWIPRARQWLDRAAEEVQYRELLIDVLVQGSGQRTSVLGRLYVLPHGRLSGAVISDLLLQKSNVIQGIQIA